MEGLPCRWLWGWLEYDITKPRNPGYGKVKVYYSAFTGASYCAVLGLGAVRDGVFCAAGNADMVPTNQHAKNEHWHNQNFIGVYGPPPPK